MKLFYLLCLLTVLVMDTSGGKVLFYIPLASKSIKITYMPLVKEMAKRGHNVTLVTPFEDKNDMPNLEIITVPSELDAFTTEFSRNILRDGGGSMPPMLKIGEAIAKGNDLALSHPELKKYLHAKDVKSQFDLIVVMAMVGETGYYLHHHFDATLVHYFTAQSSFATLDNAMGMPNNPAYMPTPILEFTHPLNFWQRIVSSVSNLAIKGFKYLYLTPKLEGVLDKHFPEPNRPRLVDLEKNGSLALHFGHPLIMDGLRPVSPNYQYIGMMNCRPAEPLPKDLKDFFDSAGEAGVVYVSFGSVLKGSEMDEEKRLLLLNVFKKLKQKVLWKWETEEMDGLPPNVKLSKWLPQQDVLAHPKLKLFITHGGQSSTQETLCHQKPGVFVPVFGDQYANAQEAERVGFGISLPFPQLSEEKLSNAINRILTDPSFRERATTQGKMLLDQIVPPLEKAVWWLEFLLRHPGKNHMRSPVHDLTWYQYFLLDVIAFFAVVMFLIGYIMYKIVSICCCSSKKEVTGKRKNKRD